MHMQDVRTQIATGFAIATILCLGLTIWISTAVHKLAAVGSTLN